MLIILTDTVIQIKMSPTCDFKTSSSQPVKLSWLKMPIRTHYSRVILTNKVGQTDVVSGVRSGFISKSVHARLQVSLQQLWFVSPLLTHRQHFDQFIWIAQPDELKSMLHSEYLTTPVRRQVVVFDSSEKLAWHLTKICCNETNRATYSLTERQTGWNVDEL